MPAIDLDPDGVRDQLRRVERLQPEPADAPFGRRLGLGRKLAGALAVEGAVPREIGDRDRLVGRPFHEDGAPDELEVVARGFELLGCRVEQLVAELDRGGDDGAAAVERRLRAARAHVVRGRVGVLVEDREVLRPHPELLGDEGRHRHHRAGAVLLGTRDDRARPVRIELHVGAGLGREARPPADGDPDRLVLGQFLPVADQLDRLLERLLHRDPLEHLARRGDRAVLDQRPAPQLDRVEIERTASSSMCCSSAQHTCGAVGARIERRRLVVRVDERRLDVDVLDLVRAERVHRRHLGEETALAAVGALVEHESRPAGHERAVGAGPVSSSITIPSRRWSIATNSSRREKTSFTGRRAARASAATCASKWKSHLAPKPPPSSGTTIRTCDSGICSVWATPSRAA